MHRRLLTALPAATAVVLLLAGCGADEGLRVAHTPPATSTAHAHARAMAPATRGARCNTLGAGLRRSLGVVAYLHGHALHLLDLGGCRRRTVIHRGASAPVRFSPDGDWIGYGPATVTSLDGRTVLRPLGRHVAEWAWLRDGAGLVGVTEGGGLRFGRPGEDPVQVRPDGWGAVGVVVSPATGAIAVARAGAPAGHPPGQDGGRAAQIWAFEAPSRDGRLVRRLPHGTATVQVAGFVAGGRWLLYWPNRYGSASLAADGFPLHAVHPDGRGAHTVATAMLLYRDWIARCGSRTVLAVGGIRAANRDKALALVAPRDLVVHGTLADGVRSWISPDCAPGGDGVVAAAGPNHGERRFGDERRSIWRLSLTSGQRRRLTPRPPRHVSDEEPRLSRDGRWVMYVRSGPLRHHALPGRLYLVSADGKRRIGPLATLGPAGVYYGQTTWSQELDWRQAG